VVKRVVVGVVVALFAQGCVHRLPQSKPARLELTRGVTLNGFPVTLHLVRPVVAPRGPLLIYATGDGGWRGKDLDLFRHLASWGYAMAGFSAPEYIKHLRGDEETTTPALWRATTRRSSIRRGRADVAGVHAGHPRRRLERRRLVGGCSRPASNSAVA
jgi:hypothetical protein